MYKIKKIKFHNHPILGDIALDFCDQSGKAADTIILAGENGTGKSTILETIYQISNRTIDNEVELKMEDLKMGQERNIKYYRENETIYLSENGSKRYIGILGDKYKFPCIYSTVAINFRSREIETVKSSSLDEKTQCSLSDENLAMQIKQLLVDIQSQDDSNYAQIARENRRASYDEIMASGNFKPKMPRFTKAFERMFSDIKYSGLETNAGHKNIMFKKFNQPVSVEQLSSGEKQIVYRGCFLLRNINAMLGAFVLIDEPEISLHPRWQEKIMDYYKGIFTNEEGIQTSQIFFVTHSPFIIHNDNRKNDKILVLKRDVDGRIIVENKPEYYFCKSVEAVQDAFSTNILSLNIPTIYVEGRTDERYFKKTIEVFDLKVPFEVKSIGYYDKNKEQLRNSGSTGLNRAYDFLVGQNPSAKQVLLYDCDCHKEKREENNVIQLSLREFKDNAKNIKKA